MVGPSANTIFVLFKFLSFRVCLAYSSETLGDITNFDMLVLVMVSISLVDGSIEFMLISSHHFNKL